MTGVLQEGRPRLVLASTSKTRARLLEAAGLSFTTKAPGLDEAVMREAISGEESLDPHDVAEVLARAKAEAVSDGASGAYVIGALVPLAVLVRAAVRGVSRAKRKRATAKLEPGADHVA